MPFHLTTDPGAMRSIDGGRRWAIPGGSRGFTWDASEWPTFLHLDLFDDEWSDLGLGDDDLQEVQGQILESPERYPVVPGTGGLRKI